MITRDNVKTEVYEVIKKELKLTTPDLEESLTLTDLSTDSIQLFELLLAFEKKYMMQAKYDDIVELITVGDVVDYIAKVKYGIN